MIRVIFYDNEGNEVYKVAYVREHLKYVPIARQQFSCEVNHGIAHIIGELREELKREKP